MSTSGRGRLDLHKLTTSEAGRAKVGFLIPKMETGRKGTTSHFFLTI